MFFEELGIPNPGIDLGIGSGTHGQQTAGMLIGLDNAIASHQPDLVLLYGDTNSTLAGALASGKLHAPVALVQQMYAQGDQ